MGPLVPSGVGRKNKGKLIVKIARPTIRIHNPEMTPISQINFQINCPLFASLSIMLFNFFVR